LEIVLGKRENLTVYGPFTAAEAIRVLLAELFIPVPGFDE
jgi:hypothetical protein